MTHKVCWLLPSVCSLLHLSCACAHAAHLKTQQIDMVFDTISWLVPVMWRWRSTTLWPVKLVRIGCTVLKLQDEEVTEG